MSRASARSATGSATGSGAGTRPLRVLFCDDRKSEREAFAALIDRRFAGVVEYAMASTLEGVRALDQHAAEGFDVVVTDLDFSQAGGGPADGLRILELARERWPRCAVMVLTAHPDRLAPRQVLEAAEHGVTRATWLSKLGDAPDAGWDALAAQLDAALARRDAREASAGAPADAPPALTASVRRYAGARLVVADEDRCDAALALVGGSGAMREAYRKLAQVAPTPATVLVTGETGTGKELVSQALHALSGRDGLVAINCGAMSDELLASQLFGHVRGAFTGADADQPGLLARVGDGTLFLDEIGELALASQAKLLRVLQDGEYRPVGASRTETTRCRVVAATNRDLRALAADGAFRRDLLDRLDVYRIHLPPLRDRPEDVPPTVVHHLARLAAELDRPIDAIDEDALWALATRAWPENVRELTGLLTRTLVDLPEGRRVVGAADLVLTTYEDIAPGAAPPDAEQCWQQILAGELRLPLPKLARRHGRPLAHGVVRLAMLHFHGLPPDEDARRLFDMSYRQWQHWAHYHGLTWDRVRREDAGQA